MDFLQTGPKFIYNKIISWILLETVSLQLVNFRSNLIVLYI